VQEEGLEPSKNPLFMRKNGVAFQLVSTLPIFLSYLNAKNGDTHQDAAAP